MIDKTEGKERDCFELRFKENRIVAIPNIQETFTAQRAKVEKSE
ncbi:hypothetical protein [Bacillus horti]|uniref:Uncharacterized protein n=1 Tax=Caldalkalibacillus horti TaxID=77523 RepID=A0ABT9VXX1_9BACI|nr:hypothetical protein [Bacillus horti]